MANFRILKGKALKTAIAGVGKKAATFSQAIHEAAYGAILHCEEHHDACYVQQLYDAMPVNYRASIAAWAKEFGKLNFDAKELTFAYSKTAKSDMEAALKISPAEYQREQKGDGKKKASPLMDRVESMFKRTIESTDASREDKAFAKAMNNAIALYKRSLVAKSEDKSQAKKTAPKTARVAKTKAAPAAKAA